MTPGPAETMLPGMEPNQEDYLSETADHCGLYVHVPFCETKCGYCDFYSVPTKERRTGPLVTALERELELRLARPPYPVKTVFCGGGTPTILPTNELCTLLSAIGRHVNVDELLEFTVEANPATVDNAKTAALLEGGVTRVSMGAQSFFSEELATLERLHTPDDIAPSVFTLRRHGIEQINIDLIFGIPGQTIPSWRESLAKTIELEPDHIACYGLTYEPGTRLTALRDHSRVTPCAESLEVELYGITIETLAAAGYLQYETSNFAKTGCESRHNLIYWRNEPYVAVGPSAAGCYHGRRYKNISEVNGYIRRIETNGSAEADTETITREMLMHEMLLMQLRLIEGLSVDNFLRRTGVNPFELFDEVIPRLTHRGYVTASDTHIALTPSGRLLSDAIITEFAIACGPRDLPLRIIDQGSASPNGATSS